MTLIDFSVYEQKLKWLAFGFGVGSTVSVVQGWHLMAMLFSLPFCIIWMYCAWLHRERQLKYINMVFSTLYIYGIARYALIV